MPSYAITGASRGIGWEFLRQLSSDSNNTVIAIVRNKASTEVKVATELSGRPNIHIVQGDLVDYAALQNAAVGTAKITGGGLDYLIANAGLVTQFDAYDPIGVLGQKPEVLEKGLMDCFRVNVVGNIHLFNLFMPLILKGQVKKIIAISSGQADLEVIPKLKIQVASAYSIAKAGLNTAVAKFSAQYSDDGVLFMSICPGMVDTGHYNDVTEEQMKGLQKMLAAFVEYAPDFKGPSPPESAVKDVISVIEKASVENGNGGTFVSHYGNKQWL
ncbi:uncharacterized protein N7459_009720 [Penicillium hispanicum]|uniref:uncharacterized protein n=1 Tax=Penicillium hispanicum TaxID=1080232 RepID=UPI0025426315|nr:uncharacterized protein N7459_009720 [Penicillium hispanicum]KAJ5570290.1 hypothetical protein N7459_009720 [Penicillium hispanicum]